MDTPEYLLNLRSFIQSGRRPDISNNGEQYLNSAAFWHNAYDKTREVELQLRARIVDLEQRLETASGTSAQATPVIVTSQSMGKRRRPTKPGGRAKKKLKTSTTAATSRVDASQLLLLDYEVDLNHDIESKSFL